MLRIFSALYFLPSNPIMKNFSILSFLSMLVYNLNNELIIKENHVLHLVFISIRDINKKHCFIKAFNLFRYNPIINVEILTQLEVHPRKPQFDWQRLLPVMTNRPCWLEDDHVALVVLYGFHQKHRYVHFEYPQVQQPQDSI